ncbi:MAG: AmmeMemoRadiSam system protein B [Candidatus Omnitrophota bacterium]|nr:AmmeMemoRadiSam system protein B [Candidatus Omnitrophota bacterium]
MVRNPAVAGQFYPGEREVLSLEIEGLTDRVKAKKEDAIGMVLPHAGYIYSGVVAGAVLASVNPKSTYIIMGPNHTGLGSPFSLCASDSWRTPLGDVKINGELTEKLLKDCDLLRKDELAHIHEHSIEVQLPFLQKLQGEFTFVPIVISVSDIKTYRHIGECMAKSIKELKMDKIVAIIASSDMTHYESQESAKEKDSKAIEAILNLDEKMLVQRVQELDISMCGFAPAAIMISAVKNLGAKKARLVKYQTSGDVSQDRSSVVGYAGIIIN